MWYTGIPYIYRTYCTLYVGYVFEKFGIYPECSSQNNYFRIGVTALLSLSLLQSRDEVESRRHNYGSTVKGNVGCGPTASLCESAFDHVTSEQRSDSLTHFSRLRSSQVPQIFHCVLSAFFSSTDDLDWEHDS